MTRRTQILEMLTMERNRLGSTRDEAARASLEAVIEFLESQVEDLNAQMADRPSRGCLHSYGTSLCEATNHQQGHGSIDPSDSNLDQALEIAQQASVTT